MKLESSASHDGYFWLPCRSKRCSGRLCISELGKCYLEILGSFGDELLIDFDNRSEFAHIHGIIGKGYVTLYDCFFVNQNINVGRLSISKLHVGRAFIGGELPPDGELQVVKLEAAVAGIDEWLQVYGIESRPQFDTDANIKGVIVEYQIPRKIEARLCDTNVAFIFACSLPSGRQLTSASVSQSARLVLSTTTAEPFDALLERLARIVNFISFCVGDFLNIDQLYAYSPSVVVEREDGRVEPERLQVIFESAAPARTLVVEHQEMFITYRDVSDRLESVLSTWLSLYDTLSPAFNLYFALQSGRSTYVESSFLSMAQALETFHSRTSKDEKVVNTEDTARVQEVISACPDEHVKWLSKILDYARKPTLRERLKYMLYPFRSHFGSSKSRDRFIENVAATRNYLTHYNPELEGRAVGGTELFRLGLKLQALFQLHVLKLLGIEMERIEEIIRTNRSLRYRMGKYVS